MSLLERESRIHLDMLGDRSDSPRINLSLDLLGLYSDILAVGDDAQIAKEIGQ